MKKFLVFSLTVLLAMLTAFLIPLNASATPITFNFTGVVVGASGSGADPWSAQGGAGDTVTGSFTYDTSLLDQSGTTSSTGLFYPVAPSFGISVTLGSKTASSINNANTTSPHHQVKVNDSSTFEQFNYVSIGSALGDWVISITLRDYDTTIDALASDALPTAFDLNKFTNFKGGSAVRYNAPGNTYTDGTLTWNFTSITIASAAVPEPSTLLLIGTGLIVLAGLSRRKLRK